MAIKRTTNQEKAFHSKATFYARFSRKLNVDKDLAEEIMMAFLGHILSRINRDEGEHLISMLPKHVREELTEAPSEPERLSGPDAIISDLEVLGEPEGIQGVDLVKGCWSFLEEFLNEQASSGKGELSDVKDQLPQQFKEIL